MGVYQFEVDSFTSLHIWLGRYITGYAKCYKGHLYHIFYIFVCQFWIKCPYEPVHQIWNWKRSQLSMTCTANNICVKHYCNQTNLVQDVSKIKWQVFLDSVHIFIWIRLLGIIRTIQHKTYKAQNKRTSVERKKLHLQLNL